MNELRKYLDIINEDINEVRNFSFYFTDEESGYDENFYVKLPNPDSNTVQRAAKIAAQYAEGEFGGAHEMDEEDIEMFDINPMEHDYFEPYLYDSGT